MSKKFFKARPHPNYGDTWCKNFGNGPATYRYEYRGAWRRIQRLTPQIHAQNVWTVYSKWFHDPYNRFFDKWLAEEKSGGRA